MDPDAVASGGLIASIAKTAGLARGAGRAAATEEVPTAARGQEYLFYTRDTCPGCGDIWMMRPDGSRAMNLTTFSLDDATPALSPDGRRVAFYSERHWRYAIYTMDLRNGGAPRRLTPDDALDMHPTWSPNGAEIAYEAYTEYRWNRYTQAWELGPGQIRVVRTRDAEVRPLVAGTSPSWSPDGKHIVFVRAGDLYVTDRRGRSLRRLTSTPTTEADPEWSPDGEEILYVGGTPGDMHVFLMEDDGSARRKLAGDTAADDSSPTWSPDGRRIAWVRHNTVSGRWDIWTMDRNGTFLDNATDSPEKEYAVDWGIVR